jgi:DNA helicase-2/ATP-dependent DNA helicase PcrA
VEAPDGPLLIFAGAGSGKTRVLTHRIAHVIATERARPEEILAVTFTNKAAREMRERIEVLLGGRTTGMWLGTFHSVGVRMLRRDGAAIGIPREFTIYDEADRVAAVRRAMQVAGVDDKRFPPSQVAHQISSAKNELQNAEEYAAAAGAYYGARIAEVFRQYERELQAAGALDFDDLLVRVVELFEDVPEVAAKYQHKFRHIFVDEYQDTNRAQYRLVQILGAVHDNVTVVGDDDQSIYGWRGADVRNILSFQRDHPDTNVVTLDQNYRSTQVILDAAHAVIRHNTERAAKKLWTERMGGQKVRIISVYDEQEEAVAITSEIERLVQSEDFSYSDCAVLYRTNAQSRALEDVLLRRGIPYRLVGGPRFYERREIKDVLAYLRLIANPRDAVSFARIVNVPRRKIGDRTVDELERLARRHGISPFEAVDRLDEAEALGAAAVAALESFRALVDGLRHDAERMVLPELVERVLVESGYKLMLQDGSQEGEERWNNVTELVGLAGEYADATPPDGLQQFLENVALVSDVDSLDSGGEGVTLITLHQVKGLEFPVVFMAGMEEGLMPHLRAMEDGEAGLAEERRLAYVGITRARQRLYLLHAFRRHLYGAPQLAEASRFLRDLPAELIEIPVRPGGPPPGDPRTPGAVHRAIHAHAVRPNPVEVAPQRYQQGMRVRHRKYGDGLILKSIMTRSGEEVTIKFEDAGLKIFAVADAGAALTPLS